MKITEGLTICELIENVESLYHKTNKSTSESMKHCEHNIFSFVIFNEIIL